MKQKKKPGCFARLLKFIGIFFAIMVVTSLLFGETEDTKTTTAKPTARATATAKPTATATVKPTATPTAEPYSVSLPTALTTIKLLLQDSFDYVEAYEKDGIIVVSISMDGFVETMTTAKALSPEAFAPLWEENTKNMIILANQIDTELEELGHDNVYMLTILNDRNKENSVLIISEGVVTYDAFLE